MARDQLGTVRQFAELREKEAGIRLSRAQVVVASAETQLRQIADYREDYQRLATGVDRNLIGTHQLQAARYFLSELDKMATKQRSTIQQAELALDRERGLWVDAKRRLTAIDKLHTQRKKAQSSANEKLQQRAQDELYSLKTHLAEQY